MSFFPALQLRPAESADDIERLRAFVAHLGQPASTVFERHLGRPRGRASLTRLLEIDGAPQGYTLIAHQRLGLGAATLDAGAIDAFYVAPNLVEDAFIALMGDCLRTLAEEGLPLVTFDGVLSQAGAFGFAPYRLATSIQFDASDETSGVLRAATNDDLDDIAALYAASYERAWLAEQRAAPDWRMWLQFNRPLVLEDSRRRVVGYALVDQQPDALLMHEAAAADSGAARLLLNALTSKLPAPLHLALPLQHTVATAAVHLGGTARIAAPSANDTPLPLAGVVDLAGMLDALAPEFERRLAQSRYAGWTGNLRVEIETTRITLALENGRATMIDGSRPADVRLRRVTLPGLAQLCLAYRSVADLRATGELDYDDSALGLLDALFPNIIA